MYQWTGEIFTYFLFHLRKILHTESERERSLRIKNCASHLRQKMSSVFSFRQISVTTLFSNLTRRRNLFVQSLFFFFECRRCPKSIFLLSISLMGRPEFKILIVTELLFVGFINKSTLDIFNSCFTIWKELPNLDTLSQRCKLYFSADSLKNIYLKACSDLRKKCNVYLKR